jgi:GT2 family glycosyltransferase
VIDEASDRGPLFSIVTPVYNTPVDVLRATIASVRAQTVDDWELVLVDDCSTDPGVLDVLRTAAASDPRVRVVERATNGHIVAASNDGVDAARGTFIALLDHDDALVPDALEHVRRVIEAEDDVDYIYTDEDKIDDHGAVFEEFKKPAWSPERLRGHMYTCHFSVLRASLVREVGGFRPGSEGSQDHDLVLRVTERARRVIHIPHVLYHWRVTPGSAAGDPTAKPYAWQNGRDAVQAHLDRSGIDADVDFGPGRGTYRITRRLDPGVRVSVVIPTRGADGLVWGERRCFVVEAVRSLLERGGHANLDVVVVHDTETPERVLATLAELGGDRLTLVPFDGQFNFSQKCNLGVLASYGDAVVILNDDVEISSDGFVAQLVAPLYEDGVGMTGANLSLPNGTVQHAGLSLDDRLAHLFAEGERTIGNPGPYLARQFLRHRVGSWLHVNREVSGVSGAALAIRRSVYDEVGGLSEAFPVNFGDVDLSRKVTSAGYRILWIVGATAFHFEARSREPEVRNAEARLITHRWLLPAFDPYLPDQPRDQALVGRRRVAYQ